MNHPIDKASKEILPGSRIAYGRARGRCAALGLATVLETEWMKPDYGEAYWRIKIQADDHDKPSFLRFPDRIVVLG